MNLKKLIRQVEWTLENKPETRNSDVLLTIEIWRIFYPGYIYEENGQEFVRVKDLFDLPREDNIKRYRAKFQNEEGRYLPTDPIIWEARGINQERWCRDLIYPIN